MGRTLHLFDNQSGEIGISTNPDFLDFNDPVYTTYDLSTAIGPIVSPMSVFRNPNGIATNNGQLILTSGQDSTFTASLGSVPNRQPSPWWAEVLRCWELSAGGDHSEGANYA